MPARMQAALAFISADHRDTWVTMAMAVKHELGDTGFDLWDNWSQTSDSYNAAAARSVWRSIKGGATTIASLFHEAKLNGWRDDGTYAKPSQELLQARAHANAERLTREGMEREKAQQQAAKKAGWILHQSKPEQHAYRDAKGFKEATGAVWWPDESTNLLCLPMRINNDLVGLQLIDRLGTKKFLAGQRTAGAEYLISNDGIGASDFWVEGYASGLSLRECLKALRMRYRLHICFSAHNLQTLAQAAGRGFIVADHDASGTGEKAAQAAGLPYYLPSMAGTDINDELKANGLFKTSQAINRFIHQTRK